MIYRSLLVSITSQTSRPAFVLEDAFSLLHFPFCFYTLVSYLHTFCVLSNEGVSYVNVDSCLQSIFRTPSSVERGPTRESLIIFYSFPALFVHLNSKRRVRASFSIAMNLLGLLQISLQNLGRVLQSSPAFSFLSF